MKNLPRLIQKEAAFSLVELLMVLAIIGTMVGLMMYGVVKFRQVVTVSNAAKEVVLNLRAVRREAIDSVVKKSPTSSKETVPDRYYVEFNGTEDYYEGASYYTPTTYTYTNWDYGSMSSEQYGGVWVSRCVDESRPNTYSHISFSQGSGEIDFGYRGNYYIRTPGRSLGSCRIEVKISGGGLTTSRFIVVDGDARTIKIDY